MKAEKIESDILKTKAKIAQLQEQIKELEKKKLEQENLEILQIIRAMNMTPQELIEFLKSGKGE